MNTACICILARFPNEQWIEFLSKFTKYDIVIIADDNSVNYSEKYAAYKSIKIVQIPDNECVANHFIHSSTVTIKKLVISWDKALYYFSSVNTSYKHVWFIEEDVFFNNEQTILDIDTKYPESDLLSKGYGENINGDKSQWHWRMIKIDIPPPYYCTMICAVRMSQKMLQRILHYTQAYKQLFFIEAMFSTICKYNNLVYDTPSELSTITWRDTFGDCDINKTNLYHPIKDINTHVKYRQGLKPA